MGILWRTWKVMRCCWPYPEGYATVFYLRGQRTIVDTGLTREEAYRIVREENRWFGDRAAKTGS
jgi:hypothetical protein